LIRKGKESDVDQTRITKPALSQTYIHSKANFLLLPYQGGGGQSISQIQWIKNTNDKEEEKRNNRLKKKACVCLAHPK